MNTSELWQAKMFALQTTVATLDTLNVLDIEFTDGKRYEVYVAATQQDRQRGLSDVSSLDLDGMLFYYEQPSYVPFHMKNMDMDLDIAHYRTNGTLICHRTFYKNYAAPIFCPEPFRYVLEAPAGTLSPTAGIVVAEDRRG